MEGEAQLEAEIGHQEHRRSAMVQNAIFKLDSPPPMQPRKKHWLIDASIFCLISAATAVMMLCACDVIDIHRHSSISKVGLAALFSISAASLVYRRMRGDFAVTAFLRAVIALAIVGVSVYVELFAAMEIVAWMAGRQ